MRYATAAGSTATALVLGGLMLAGCQADPDITSPDPPSPARAKHDLLTIAGIQRVSLTDRQTLLLSDLEAPDYVIETHIARLSPDVEPLLEFAGELGVELSATEYYVATVDDVSDEVIEGERNRYWHGSLNDTFGELSANLNSKVGINGGVADYENSKLYDFRSLGGDVVGVVRIDPRKLPPIDSKIDLTAPRMRP